jgi:hypothetical protein
MAREPTIKKKRTLVKIGVQKSEYVAGKGAKTEYENITVIAGYKEDGTPILTDCFYCEWTNNFGSIAIQLEQHSVRNPARIRLPYVREAYEALKKKGVRLYRHGKTDKENTFTVTSSPDNYLNENKLLEFNVSREETV